MQTTNTSTSTLASRSPASDSVESLAAIPTGAACCSLNRGRPAAPVADSAASQVPTPVQSIQPADLAHQFHANEKITLIDVRTPAEFRQGHVRGAVNIPLDQLSEGAIRQAFPQVDGAVGTPAAPIYFICKSGTRGRMACEKVAGRFNVVNIAEGTQGCVAAGLPIEHAAGGATGGKVISLERQVRIAAGALVLAGVVLAAAVHPWFVGLSGFVGAGLMFAGITDTCGMAMLLAKMPWNK